MGWRRLRNEPVSLGVAVVMRKLFGVVVVLVTLVALVSQGLQVVIGGPLLAAHLWFAQRSTRRAAVGWAVLAAALVAEIVWLFVYLAVGESTMAIWLAPVAAFAVTFAGVVSLGPRRHGSALPTP